ncbi:hypothetical protein Hypma_011811 [Hypsizygus marmoreus]|uniref:Uncharacterized protein n=1 Tax=Hypsizygus marmoreus TaxID=39966 RepID=A0A369JHP9_HYPMA|nr:hypothetical protein Hypma_011811 [Hypsizygus marmoreus]
MFEEICLVCGKQLLDDGYELSLSPDPPTCSPPHSLAYCSEGCQSIDTSSPSISSASSAVSSPNLGYATGGDVPALVPSALGSALNQYAFRSRHHYSVSSSSASSTSCSALTDDDDDDAAIVSVSSYRYKAFHNSVDSIYEGSSKSANFADCIKPSLLSYARRPSGTNNRSTVSNPHKLTSPNHVDDAPRSAPLHSHMSTDDDGGYSDIGFSSRDESDAEFHALKPTKPKRSRASLPGYFSLLQMSSPSEGKRSSPMSSSSAHTIARPSPPTPKLPLAGLTLSSTTVPSLITHATPRGRRRAPEASRSSRYSGDSSSRSSSRTRSRRPSHFSPGPPRSHVPDESDDERVIGWSASALARGRAPVRRNSSPPPKMMLSSIALEDHNRALAAKADAALAPAYRRIRGRTKPEPFDDTYAPGFGHGRSGLVDRERVGGRPTRAL